MLGLSWSTLHYKPVGVSPRDLAMMNLIDLQYTATPFYGARRMAKALQDKKYQVGREHVGTLMFKMGLEAVFPKPNTSKPNPEHKIYPYLLRDVDITRINQVWSTDITYIKLAQGFGYLTAVIDWNTRYVLSWRLSNTIDSGFCIEALEEALAWHGNPEIFNSDQGAQFTSGKFIKVLSDRGISISMDGRGRALDNIFVERLWRSVKYEDVFLKGYQNIPEARAGLKKYFEFYNNTRYHQSLGYKTPAQVYFGEGGETRAWAAAVGATENFTLASA